jgi:hypothetical protein
VDPVGLHTTGIKKKLKGIGDLRVILESVSKTCVTGMGCEGVTWSQLAHGRVIWWAFTNTALYSYK